LIYRKHIIPDLYEIGNVFENMASGTYKYHQFVDGNLVEKTPQVQYQKWEKVDDRFDSLFGATYKVRTKPLPVNDSPFKITVYGDKWLCNNKVIIKTRMLDRWEQTQIYESVNNEVKSSFSSNLNPNPGYPPKP
jgi:hypothetical protein